MLNSKEHITPSARHWLKISSFSVKKTAEKGFEVYANLSSKN